LKLVELKNMLIKSKSVQWFHLLNIVKALLEGVPKIKKYPYIYKYNPGNIKRNLWPRRKFYKKKKKQKET